MTQDVLEAALLLFHHRVVPLPVLHGEIHGRTSRRTFHRLPLEPLDQELNRRHPLEHSDMQTISSPVRTDHPHQGQDRRQKMMPPKRGGKLTRRGRRCEVRRDRSLRLKSIHHHRDLMTGEAHDHLLPDHKLPRSPGEMAMHLVILVAMNLPLPILLHITHNAQTEHRLPNNNHINKRRRETNPM